MPSSRTRLPKDFRAPATRGSTVPIDSYRAPPAQGSHVSGRKGFAEQARRCLPRTDVPPDHEGSGKASEHEGSRVSAARGHRDPRYSRKGKGERDRVPKLSIGRRQRAAFPRTPVFSRFTASSGQAGARQSFPRNSYGRPPRTASSRPSRGPSDRRLAGGLCHAPRGVPPPSISAASIEQPSGQ